MNYLGYSLSGDRIAPGKEQLQAVHNFSAPTSVKQIREFVGLCNYFQFLNTWICLPLRWCALPPLAGSAFQYLKSKLCDSPLVSHPRRGFMFHLATDPCAGDDNNKYRFGAVLTQVWEDGAEYVIAYSSRSLQANKENYSAYLLELVAASWAIAHFSVYLRDKHFELFTDYKPLEMLSKVHKKTLNCLEQQWSMISKLITGKAPVILLLMHFIVRWL